MTLTRRKPEQLTDLKKFNGDIKFLLFFVSLIWFVMVSSVSLFLLVCLNTIYFLLYFVEENNYDIPTIFLLDICCSGNIKRNLFINPSGYLCFFLFFFFLEYKNPDPLTPNQLNSFYLHSYLFLTTSNRNISSDCMRF